MAIKETFTELTLTRITEEQTWQLYCLAILIKNNPKLEKTYLHEYASSLIASIDRTCKTENTEERPLVSGE